MTVFDTIVAECSFPAKSSLSIIRLTGKDAFNIFQNIIKRDVSKLEFRKTHYLKLYKDINDLNTIIDHAVVVLYDGKHSFAGEDTVEFYVHGSRVIVNELIETLIHFGARRALGGEFSQKAYLNGKLDLTEAEAINQLINARTSKSKKFALKTLEGDSSKEIKAMKEELNYLTAQIEVDIDYPEYEESVDIVQRIQEVVPPMLNKAKELLKGSRQSTYLFNGIRVVIIGEPNVGKSTLLNKILNQDKAIVTSIPGTTRDIVEGEKEIDGILYKFYDTAGIREEAGEIEKIGIEKTYKVLKDADIILLLIEKGRKIDEEIDNLEVKSLIENKPCLYISTKKDLVGENEYADISISKDDENLDKLYKLIQEKLNIDEYLDTGFASQRDLDILEVFVERLEEIVRDLKDGLTVDVMESGLIEATRCLDQMLGVESTLEDIYSTVFKYFCVGK